VTQRKKARIGFDTAAVYEEVFVPAVFAQWTSRVVSAAGVGPGHRVLDVACGTGVLARAVADKLGPAGHVVGLDTNAGMLSIAARSSPDIEWRQGLAESLPFEENRFDAVVCQFGLMYFHDPVAAIREMMRVLRPGGRLAAAVWDSLDRTPGYAALVDLLQRLFGRPAADALRAPFALGDSNTLSSLFAEAGIPSATITTYAGTACFPTLESWLHAEVNGWLPLRKQLDDTQYETLVDEAEHQLQSLVNADRTVRFSTPAHVVSATKP
jgi:SAM-dependent methyltransferase